MSDAPPIKMAPPSEAPAPPPKRRASYMGCVFAVGLLFVGFVFVAAVLFPVFARARRDGWTKNCQGRLRRIWTASMMYQTDYDGALPDPGKWMDLTYEVRPKRFISVFTGRGGTNFHCPEVRSGQGYGYAYNSALSGKKLSQVSPATALVFDSTLMGRNAHSGLETLPVKGRHVSGPVQGNNVVDLDGSLRFVGSGSR